MMMHPYLHATFLFSTTMMITSAALLLRHHQVLGFPCLNAQQQRRFRSRKLYNTGGLRASPTGDDAPAGDDIVARARERAGATKEEDPPSLFDDDLRADMREALFKLERRVQEGPSALSMLEVEQLEGELRRIGDEMRMNQHKKPPRPPRSSDENDEPGSSLQSSSHPSSTIAAPRTPQQAASSQESLLHADPEAIASLREEKELDRSQTEEAGRGGMGQPRGTVNTYIIPGMDEMSPEEYRDALQQSVIDRQRRRRGSQVVGNRSSQNYLDNLNGNK